MSGNAAQIDYWNDQAGRSWAEFQPYLDQQIEPLGAAAIDRLAPAAGETILDIGCGCGQTTLQLAVRVGADGRVVGVDVSRPMLQVARRRHKSVAARARHQSAAVGRVVFREADAGCDPIDGAPFDAAFSRFGVMFFADPVAAFGHIRSLLRPHGRLTFVCWQGLAVNPWMEVPLRAALPFLPPLTPGDPLAPGPFALADPARIGSLLKAAGFTAVEIAPFLTEIGGNDLEQTRRLSFRVGPLAAALRDHPDRIALVRAAVERALAAYQTAGGVWLPAAVWLVSAKAP